MELVGIESPGSALSDLEQGFLIADFLLSGSESVAGGSQSVLVGIGGKLNLVQPFPRILNLITGLSQVLILLLERSGNGDDLVPSELLLLTASFRDLEDPTE
jgi:hypothetical protein